uniref:Uncharacterized protein n=1 Tax=Arion vulgaris TaxID=1028688 RepID=A0A0B6YTJ6_9EUPU
MLIFFRREMATDLTLAGKGAGSSKPSKLPNPVTLIVKTLRKKGAVQVIDYYYDQEKGDCVDFGFKPAEGNRGQKAVFTITRSSSSSSRNVLDSSQIIPDDVMDKFVAKKKLKDKFYRVKLKKKDGCSDLDLAKYFGVSEQLSSSDEDQKSG